MPHLDAKHLSRGHAVHFRCQRADVAKLRIDLMSSLRGVSPFDQLWERRTTIEVNGEAIDMLGLEDLVQAKKTQRDKDWPMIRRLLEQSFLDQSESPGARLVEFWLRELRTPELLIRVVAEFPSEAGRVSAFQGAIRGRGRGTAQGSHLLGTAQKRIGGIPASPDISAPSLFL